MVRKAALALALIATPAMAEGTDGNVLYRQCTSSGYLEQAACHQYIIGVVDGINLASETGLEPFTLPPGVKGEQVKDVVMRYLRDYPERRHWAGAVLVWNAMMTGFPNPKYLERYPQREK